MQSEEQRSCILFAKAEEICGLLYKDTFQFVCREETPEDATFLGGRFVLAMKNTETSRPEYKAIFVVKGHTDAEMDMLVHSENTVFQHSIRLLVAIAASFGIRLCSKNGVGAYLKVGK